MATTKDEALAAIARGWKVFPLKVRSKKPATPHGFKDWTDDPESIETIWNAHPDLNLAITTGLVSGIVVIDIDYDGEQGYDGYETLREWESEHGELPETVTEITGRGGMHYFYRTDRVTPTYKNTIDHIDVRGDGGYAMMAGSVHPDTGRTVEWENHPDDYEIAWADDNVYALIEHFQRRKQDSESSDDGGGWDLPQGDVLKGDRDETLFKYASLMRTNKTPKDVASTLLHAYNKQHCKPPMPDYVVDKKLESAWKYKPGMSDEALEAQSKSDEKPQRGRPRKFDHAGIANQLMEQNGACMVDGMPAIRHDKIYEIGWRSVDREIILIDQNANRTNQREVQHYLTVMAENKAQSPPNLIAFRNGVLDIKTMELRDYEESDVIPNVIPCDWNPDAECQIVDDVLLKMACNDVDIFQSLIEVMGVCMYRSSEFTQSAILLGEGSNGKSTFIRMLTALLGKENIATISMTQIGKQFLVGRLAGKLANLGSEISNEFKNGDLLATFKELVDGNRMHADVKGVEGFDFESYATIVMCANEFPKLADCTDGMMRRIFPIEFNAKFQKTDPDYDPRIAQKLSSNAAKQRMAILGVAGLQDAIKHNGFTPNAASVRRLEEIKTDNDNVKAWLEETEWTGETIHETPTATLYGTYREWCDAFGYQNYGHKKFSKLVNKHLGTECKKNRVNSVPINCFWYRNGL